MKTTFPLLAAGLQLFLLTGCDPSAFQSGTAAQDEIRRQMEETRAAYEREAADMQARGEALQNELAALKLQLQEQENAELQARLQAMEAENQRLLADADAARQKADELRDQLLTQPVPQPPVVQPVQPLSPVLPVAQVPVAQPWMDPGADYSLFYDQLSPHGDWLDVEGYGYAWRPRLAAQASWRPYMDGRWMWSDHGWAWNSNEPFGWACYHYGRWVRVSRHGWVWIPGREWAPAWVSWRTGPDYVGWAPLPPGPGFNVSYISHDCDVRYGLSPGSYFFIQSSHFGRSSYTSFGLSITNVTRIFASTVNVTNITVVNHSQSRFFAHRGGPDRNWIERRLGTPVPRAQVQVHRTLDRSLLTPRSSRDGPVVLAAAPLPSGRADRPRELPRISQRVSRPEIVDGWSEVPQANRTSLREMITRQARETRPSSTTPPGPSPTVVREIPSTPPSSRPSPTGSSREEVRPAISNPSGRGPALTSRDRPGTETARPPMPDARPGTPAAPAAPAAPAPSEADRRSREADSIRARAAELARQQEEARKKMEDTARAKAAQESQQRADMERRSREAETLRARAAEAARQQADARKKMEEATRARAQQDAARKQAEDSARRRAAEQQKQIEDMRRKQMEDAQRRQRDEAAARARSEAARQAAARQSALQEAARRQQAARSAPPPTRSATPATRSAPPPMRSDPAPSSRSSRAPSSSEDPRGKDRRSR